MLDRSFLTQTGQQWKLLTALALMGIGLYFTVGLSGHAESSTRGLLYFFSGLSLSFAAMIWLAVSVRCPKCGVRLVWRAATTRDVGDWLGNLLRSGKCPSCGFEPVRD
jgi:predicted RNA-binding Zn-ribbon protein involved in translation (DUF1610 family)